MATSVAVLGLAATCVDLVGAAENLAFSINRLLRTYEGTPPELKSLQSQSAVGKQTLDTLVSLLDRDHPAFQHDQDVAALKLHCNAIAFVLKDVQEHVARIEGVATAGTRSWNDLTDLWRSCEMHETEERLRRQLSALDAYIGVAKHDRDARQVAEITHQGDNARVESARKDASTYILTEPASVASGVHEERPDDEDTRGPAPTSRVPFISTPNGVDLGQQASLSPNSDGSPVIHSTSSMSLSQSTGQLTLGRVKDRTSLFPSARKIKSAIMLHKESSTQLNLLGQGDEVHSIEFKARVTAYTSGVTPAWELVTVTREKRKGEFQKQKYRNRFTRDPSDDISPSKLPSLFKITERELWQAILNKEKDKVHELMQHKWSNNPMVEKHDRLSALHVATSLGLCGIVQTLVDMGAKPNTKDKFGATPLHYAADFGCPDCISILVNGGADVNKAQPKTKIRTPIWYAADRGHVDTVCTLLAVGAHIFIQTPGPEETVLYAAVRSGSVRLCEALLGAGANPSESFEVLSLAANVSREMLGCLRKAGADLNIRNKAQDGLLHLYATANDVSMVELLLSLGADASLTDGTKRTPLHLAVLKGGTPITPRIVKSLIDKGARLNAQNQLGQTALHMAVLFGRADVAEILCQAGASLDIADTKGVTPAAETRTPGYTARLGGEYADFEGTVEIMLHWCEQSPTTGSSGPKRARKGGNATELAAPNQGKGVAMETQELDARPVASELPA